MIHSWYLIASRECPIWALLVPLLNLLTEIRHICISSLKKRTAAISDGSKYTHPHGRDQRAVALGILLAFRSPLTLLTKAPAQSTLPDRRYVTHSQVVRRRRSRGQNIPRNAARKHDTQRARCDLLVIFIVAGEAMLRLIRCGKTEVDGSGLDVVHLRQNKPKHRQRQNKTAREGSSVA